MLEKFIKRLLGDQNQKTLRKLEPLVKKVNEIAEKYESELKDEDFPKKTEEFKERLKKGETVDGLMPEAFALVKVACGRLVGKKWEVRGEEFTWDIKSPYDVQILGGIVLHQGAVGEMKTGEGKTLVCTMPLYLNALTEKGVFLVTVNEYLAARDAEWMGGLYNFLGLTVGTLIHGQNHEEKKEIYSRDIIYGTNNEFGFDYLRDNMATSLERIVQRDLNYAIIDEVDSILIDEARTPLIISAPAGESTEKYQKYSRLIPQLTENEHYNIDEKMKTATLNDDGIAKMEQILGINNIYTEAGFSEVHHIEQALKAQTVFKKDIDYVVKDNAIVIVDEFTGRLMAGRRYSHGLHQAIEAKENVDIKRESKTLATVTLQNYFRLFNKLAGMTGTAATEADEFEKIYRMDTIVVPTNKPIARKDTADVIYKNLKGKFMAVAKKTKELNDKGQPVLIGTISIEKSEALSSILKSQGVKHNVLNAKQHEQESNIVKNAGQKGAVTIATNMAGRGTDIKLTKEVLDLGGLYVIGTERHESRRIDNQLRGRSGRQGDPGVTQFYVSMEDDLMRLFGADRIKRIMDALKVPDDMPIENAIITKSIESAQKKVEGRNFDIRKHLVQYDDVMNWHREIIYKRRRTMLEAESIKDETLKLIEEEAEAIVLNHVADRKVEDWNYEEIVETANSIVHGLLNLEDLKKIRNEEELVKYVKDTLLKAYESKEKSLPEEKIMRDVEKQVSLRTIDVLWMAHIDFMTQLREAVALRGYSQRDPLIEYQQDGFKKFDELLAMIRTNTVHTLFKIDIQINAPEIKREEVKTQTNEAQVEGVLSGSSTNKAPSNPAVVNHAVMPSQGDGITRIRVADEEATPTSQSGAAIKAEPVEKVGRNEPCPCGSGKKYKKCHGKA